jgi:hypothetical protein
MTLGLRVISDIRRSPIEIGAYADIIIGMSVEAHTLKFWPHNNMTMLDASVEC